MLGACGGAASESVGSSAPQVRSRPIEMTLRTPGGEWIHLGDLRGKPLILYVFATWDGVSQAGLRPVGRFARLHDDVAIIGVAAQEDAAMLLDPYEHALNPGFPMTYDPERRVHVGLSPLGDISAVPTVIAFDANGIEFERHVGFPNTDTLPAMRDEALSRGGIGPREPVPLIGAD